MTQPPLRLCVIQPSSPAGRPDDAFLTLERGLAAARGAGADVAVFPELLLPGYNATNIPDLAQTQGGDWLRRASSMTRAAGVASVFGYAERAGSAAFNSAVAIGPDGAVLAHYRKIQLYGPREAKLFTPGNAYATFSLKGRTAALLICYDIEFAPHVAALAARGVSLVLVPTANMLPFEHVSRLTVPAQAVTQGLAIAYANYAGREGDLTYSGGSLIVNADGAVLAQAGMSEAILVADLHGPDPALLSTQARDLRAIG